MFVRCQLFASLYRFLQHRIFFLFFVRRRSNKQQICVKSYIVSLIKYKKTKYFICKILVQAGQCGNQIGAKVCIDTKFQLEINFLIFFPSFGKLSQMNMVLIQLVHTMATQIFNLNVLTFITMKLPVN